MPYKDLTKKREWARQYYWKRKTTGKCTRCGTGKVVYPSCMCIECKEKMKAKSKRFREQYKKEGRCPRCGRQLDDGFLCCPDCVDAIPVIRGEYETFRYPDFA